MDLIDKKLLDEKISGAIQLAINCESLFKLYSYRVIAPEDFLTAITEELELRLPVITKELETVEE